MANETENLILTDLAKNEILEAINNIGSKYGMTATSMIYLLNSIVSESRVHEYQIALQNVLNEKPQPEEQPNIEAKPKHDAKDSKKDNEQVS